jgi:hypothetical protein
MHVSDVILLDRSMAQSPPFPTGYREQRWCTVHPVEHDVKKKSWINFPSEPKQYVNDRDNESTEYNTTTCRIMLLEWCWIVAGATDQCPSQCTTKKHYFVGKHSRMGPYKDSQVCPGNPKRIEYLTMNELINDMFIRVASNLFK